MRVLACRPTSTRWLRGLTEDHVHDAVRIAATVNAAAVALEMVEEPVEVSA